MLRGITRRIVSACCGTILCFCAVTDAQMTTGERMTDFAKTFDVKVNARSQPFNAVLIESNIPANILWPGDQPTWTIQLQNESGEPIKTSGKIDIIRYGTHGEPGDVWVPTTIKLGNAGSVSIDVNLPAHGFQNVTISPKLPDTFGGYGIVADLGSAGRRFAFSCVRTFKPTPERLQYPSLSLDDVPGETLPRIGIQAIRHGIPWEVPGTDEFDKAMAGLDEKMQDDMKKKITVMLMIDPSKVDQPLGRSRPHLDAQGVMLQTKSDMAWLPSEDPAFEKWVATVTGKYGWPKGPVTAISLWNEPWEGISISGWGADMLRYREIYRHMAAGVLTARKDDNVQVLVGGCDSSSNAIDKLFPDDSDEFLPIFDFVSIHYQGMHTPATYKKWLNRTGPYGRVQIWDTESWVANVDDRVAAVVATNKSVGYDRAMGVYGGNVSDHTPAEMMLDNGQRKKIRMDTAWSTAASVGAAVHFIGERHFNRLLFQNGLPWVMMFDGLPGEGGAPEADDGTIVVVGDIGEEFGKDHLLHRSIMGLKQIPEMKAAKEKLAALAMDAPGAERKALQKQVTALSIISGATMVLDDGGGKFKLFDFYGNPQPGENGKITVPLDGRGFFLRSDGSPGSFAALTDAVTASHVSGFECLELVPHDLLATVETQPTMVVTCTNVLNRPVTGKLTATLGKLQIQAPDSLTFNAGETRDVAIKIVGGSSVPENSYPLSLKFDAGDDGYSVHDENMHVNVISRRTVVIDGKLDDWKGVLPQTVSSDGSAGPTMQEAAWYPFQKFDTSVKSGLATGYLAYDDNNFYFAAKIADADPDAGAMRFETRNDDQFFYPDVSYEVDGANSFATKPGVISQELRKPFALRMPDGSQQRNYQTIESVAKAFKIRLSFAQPRQVAFYFLDDDEHESGRRTVDVSVADANSKKVLDKQRAIKAYGRGIYAVYQVSGDVEFTFRSPVSAFSNASVAGYFLDDSQGPGSGVSSAKFVKFDEQTQGNWQGVYGRQGYSIAGLPPQLGPDVKMEDSSNVQKKEHVWPEGIRHFSYREKPVLPSGNSPYFDNVQIAFNSIPLEDDPVVTPSPPGTPSKYAAYRDTDYQFALNKVAEQYGGGTEIWRLDVPDHMRIHFWPRQPKASFVGPAKDGKLVVTQDGGTRIVECSLPWSEIPDVKKLLDANKPVKFSFRVNSHTGNGMELAHDRGVSRQNNFAFHADWIEHWANELEFAFDKK